MLLLGQPFSLFPYIIKLNERRTRIHLLPAFMCPTPLILLLLLMMMSTEWESLLEETPELSQGDGETY